eukprot:1161754-Pelagomonas_calceolata.AAC.4
MLDAREVSDARGPLFQLPWPAQAAVQWDSGCSAMGSANRQKEKKNQQRKREGPPYYLGYKMPVLLQGFMVTRVNKPPTSESAPPKRLDIHVGRAILNFWAASHTLKLHQRLSMCLIKVLSFNTTLWHICNVSLETMQQLNSIENKNL